MQAAGDRTGGTVSGSRIVYNPCVNTMRQRNEDRTLLEPTLINFQNIRVMRGEKFALDDFSLQIASHEHVAILGPNGCGKSTLIKTITRECYPVARENSRIHDPRKPAVECL